MNRLITMVAECHESIVNSASELEILSEVCRIICEVGRYTRAWVGYADEVAAPSLKCMAAAGYGPGFPDFRETHLTTTGRTCSPAAAAMIAGRAVIVNDIAFEAPESPWRAYALGDGCRASIAVPLTFGERAFGVLAVHAADVGAFGTPAAALVCHIAADASRCIGALRERREVRTAATQTEKNREVFMLAAMLDTQGLIGYLSPSYDALLGDSGALIGNQFLTEIHPFDRVRVRGILAETVKTGNGGSIEYRLLSRDGSIRFIESQVSAIRDAAGVVTQLLVFSRDITERKGADAKRVAVKQSMPPDSTKDRIGAEEITHVPGLSKALGGVVLVVEDEPDILRLLTLILEGGGFPVLTASDGLEAVELYRRNRERVGLVISDIHLPKQSGAEVFAEIRKLNPAAKVIFSSGSIDPEVRARLVQQGASGFVEKPYMAREIVQTIRTIMGMP